MREIVGGLALLSGSGLYLLAALQYRLGTAVRMGPGYFPMLLGIAGILIAIAIIARGVVMHRSPGHGHDDVGPQLSLRPMVAVVASITAFAVAIHWLGLLVAIAASIVAAAFADRSSTLRGTILLALFLCAACWLVFVYMLGLPIPIIGSSS